jgi:hypothetical protein
MGNQSFHSKSRLWAAEKERILFLEKIVNSVFKKKLVQSQHLKNSAHGVTGMGRGGRVGRPPREAKFKGGKINNLNEKFYLIISTNFKLLTQTQTNPINNCYYA